MELPNKKMLCHIATQDLVEELLKRNFGSIIKVNQGEKYTIRVEYSEECANILGGYNAPCTIIEIPYILDIKN